MPYLNAQLTPQGPVVELLIGVSQPREAALRQQSQPVPEPARLRALLDTGASGTVVDPEIIRHLALTPTSAGQVATPATPTVPQPVDLYDVRITLLHPELAFSFHAVPVIAAPLKHLGVHALIGRDLLANCLLVYDGRNGTYSLAF